MHRWFFTLVSRCGDKSKIVKINVILYNVSESNRESKIRRRVWENDMIGQERLEAFEKMYQNVKDRYADTCQKMDMLKAEGKVKSVTYKQLMADKLTLQKMLGMYDIYGL